MIYGTKELKNGKKSGQLRFDTGKVIHLTYREVEELEQRIKDWQYQAVEQERIRWENE